MFGEERMALVSLNILKFEMYVAPFHTVPTIVTENLYQKDKSMFLLKITSSGHVMFIKQD